MPSPSGLSEATQYTIDSSQSIEINALLGDTKWGSTGIGNGASISYSFPTSSSALLWSFYYKVDPTSETEQGFRALSSSEKASFDAAINAWSNVANIQIASLPAESEVEVGDIRVAYTTGGVMDSDTLAYAYTPGSHPASGDIWINNDGYVYTGNQFEATLLHEIGHALGLDHPFEDGSAKTYVLPSALDSYKLSIMSYSVAPNQSDYGDSTIYPTTPMLLDIQAMQYLYGANMEHNAGDDLYSFNEGQDYYQTIWDAGGTDTIQYTGNNDVIINLTAGSFSSLGNPVSYTTYDSATNTYPTTLQDENVAIAYNVVIENATGGSGDDTLTGNAHNNNLNGGLGNDVMLGNLGDDVMSGGLGNDIYEVTDDGDVIIENANEGYDRVWSYTANYTMSENVEELNAVGGAALMIGNDLDNVMNGNYGDNIIVGKAGNDTMRGGLGNDVYEVTEDGDLVIESANEGYDRVWSYTANYTMAENVEELNAAGGAALIIGNGLDNVMNGNYGDNIIVGKAGNDTMRGGLGNDVYEVTEDGDLVIENANEGYDRIWSYTANYTMAENVEELNAAGGAALIIGNGLDNVMNGNYGNNVIVGKAGNDTMSGGLGNDVYEVTDDGDVVIEGAHAGTDTVWSYTYTYTLTDNVENLNAGGGGAWLVGNALNNTIVGNYGNNIIVGNAGDDIIVGNAGDDIMTGGLGADTFKWVLGDQNTTSSPSLDTITDFSLTTTDTQYILSGDRIDLRDLLDDAAGYTPYSLEPNPSPGNIQAYLDFNVTAEQTEIRISTQGGFGEEGIYDASQEDARIILSDVDLYAQSGTNNEVDLLHSLMVNNIINVNPYDPFTI